MSDIKGILKSIGSELRKAQNNMFSAKFQEAAEIVVTLDRLLEDAVAADPGHVQVKTYTNQIEKLKKDLQQRMERVPSGTARPASTPPPQSGEPRSTAIASEEVSPPATSSAGTGPAMPAGVKKRIRDMGDLMKRGKLRDAASVLEEIDRQYAGQFDEDNPDYVDIKQRLEAALEAEEGEAQKAEAERDRDDKERAEREELSKEWEGKLREIPPFNIRTENIQDLLGQQEAFGVAKRVYSEYETVDFPHGKAYGLEQMEKTISVNMEQFPSLIEKAWRTALEEAIAHIDSRYSGLDRVIEGKPGIMNDGSIGQTEAFLEKFWALFPEGTDEHAQIRKRFDALIQKNLANREERAKLTLMREDAYSGGDASDIKKRMEELVLSADGAGGVVRSGVYSPEWKEVSLWEDYAGDRRFVTRGEIYGQVIAEVQGVSKLFTVYITKEKKSDGSWSLLTGNVMHIEDIAGENI